MMGKSDFFFFLHTSDFLIKQFHILYISSRGHHWAIHNLAGSFSDDSAIELNRNLVYTAY